MAGSYIGKYDTTAANNTATGTGSVSIAEGMLPSNVNNAMRDIMADIRQWYNSAEWIEYGDGAGSYTPAYASGTSFTIASADVTSAYHVGRRVKAVGSSTGTIYGSITATSFSTNTTVTVSWDSGSLSSESLTIYIGITSATNTSMPETPSITGDYTLDVSGDIILDADGGDVFFKDGGTTFGSATNTSGNLIIKSGTTTALTFSGANVTLAGDLTISGDDLTMGTNTSGMLLVADGTNFNPVAVSGDVTMASNGAVTIASSAVESSMLAGSIADSKLSTISTAGKVDIGALEIDGASDIGANLVDADLIIVDDGANGTEKKSAMSRVATYIQGGISGDITISSGTAAIGSGVIVNADVNASAAIADSKLATISTADKVSAAAIQVDGATDGTGITVASSDKLIVDDAGTTKYINVSQLPTTATAADDIATGDGAVTLSTSSGNITIDATANNTDIIFKGTDATSDITMLTLDGSEAGNAAFNADVTVGALFKMPDVTSAKILVADGTSYQEVAVSGDVSIASTGAVTIASTAVETSMIAADAITNAKIADDAIDSEHYTDGSIDTAHLSSDAITGAKIADDAVDSEHYTDASVDFAHIQNVAANSILGRNADSSGVLSEIALATTQILIGDGTGFTAAALSGDVTMTNAGVVSIAANSVDGTHIALGSDAAGDIMYYNGTNYVRLAKGNEDQLLTMGGSNAPTWADAASGGIGMGKAIAAALVFG